MTAHVHSTAGQPVSVALVVPRHGLREWQVAAIKRVERSGTIRVDAVLESDGERRSAGDRALSLLSMMESVGRRGPTASPGTGRQLRHSCQARDAWPHADRPSGTAGPRRWPLIVNLSSHDMTERVMDMATRGVLEFRIGASHDLDDALESCRLRKDTIQLSGVLVSRRGSAPVGHAVAGVRERTLVVSSVELLLARAATVLSRSIITACGPRRDDAVAAQPRPEPPSPPLSWGGAASLVGSALADYARTVKTRLQSGRPGWFLAYRESPAHFIGRTLTCSAEALSVITSPPDCFYADPCVFAHEGVDHLFFEDYRYAEGKAVISWMQHLGPGRFSEPQSVLEQPYHLAYPLVFAYDGEIFMLPDTPQARRVELYRAVEFPRRWARAAVLIEDVEAADATVFEYQGRWWMFVSLADHRSSLCDELSVFHAASPLGPWHPHPANPVKSDVRSARPAGRPFYHEGRLIRPAQDCSRTYGGSVTLCEVLELSTTSYRERVIAELDAGWLPGNARFHTVSFSDRLEVIDGSQCQGLRRGAA